MRPGFAFLLTLLLVPALAHGLPWWVGDEDEGERLGALLDALWPGHPIEVEVGEPDFGQEGVSSDGATLTLVHGDRVRFSPTDGDMATQVALVKSWLRTRAVEEGGWVPPTERPLRPGPYALVLFGGGARLPTASSTATGEFLLGPASPSGKIGLGGGMAWKHVRLGAQFSWSFGERAGVGSQAIQLQRLLGGATASLVAQLGSMELVNTLGGGVRVAVLRTDDEDSKALTRVVPTLFGAIQLWGPLGELIDVGGGLGVSFDTAPLAVRVGEDSVPLLLSPVTVYGEFGVRIGCPCRRGDRSSKKM